MNHDARLLQNLKRLTYNHLRFQIAQHFNFAFFIKQRRQEQQCAKILGANRSRHFNFSALGGSAMDRNRQSAIIVIYFYSHILKSFDQIAVWTFAQGIRIFIYKSNVRAKSGNRHQKTKYCPGIANV
ncbi:hypothetical protein D3C80_1525540 [compost metagenome]